MVFTACATPPASWAACAADTVRDAIPSETVTHQHLLRPWSADGSRDRVEFELANSSVPWSTVISQWSSRPDHGEPWRGDSRYLRALHEQGTGGIALPFVLGVVQTAEACRACTPSTGQCRRDRTLQAMLHTGCSASHRARHPVAIAAPEPRQHRG